MQGHLIRPLISRLDGIGNGEPGDGRVPALVDTGGARKAHPLVAQHAMAMLQSALRSGEDLTAGVLPQEWTGSTNPR